MERHFDRPQINYEDFLETRLVDMSHDRSRGYTFAVTNAYNIFITSASHERLSEAYGVDLDSTLLEGYIRFDAAGNVSNVDFKSMPYQPAPGFKGSQEELAQLKAAVAKKVKAALTK